MALLIVDLDKHIGNARAWRDTFGEQLPDLDVRVWPEAGDLADNPDLCSMQDLQFRDSPRLFLKFKAQES